MLDISFQDLCLALGKMVLNKLITNIIDDNSHIFYDIPFDYILDDLRLESILSDNDISLITDQDMDKTKRVPRFLKVLKSKCDTQFFQFCLVLIQNSHETIQEVGQILEQKLKDVVEMREGNGVTTLC